MHQKSIKRNVFWTFFILSLLLLFVTGGVLYEITYRKYYDLFLREKHSLVQSIKNRIDFEVHAQISERSSLDEASVQGILNTLSSELERDGDVLYLYTLKYNAETDQLFYGVDGSIVKYDTLWIESEDFYLQLIVDENRQVWLENNTVLAKKHKIDLWSKNNTKVEISIQEAEKPTVYLDKKPLLTVLNVQPLTVSVNGKLMQQNYSDVEQTFSNIKGHNVDILFNLTLKDSPAAKPGTPYIYEESFLNSLKKIFREHQAKPGIIEDQQYINIYEPLLNTQGHVDGLILAEVSKEFLKTFRMDFTMYFFSIIFGMVLITFFAARGFSKLITDPIIDLAKGVSAVKKGDYSTEVVSSREDELGSLANSFNDMVISVKEANHKITQQANSYKRFVPEQFLAHLGKSNIEDVKLGDHQAEELTILFTDIRDYSALSEKLSPEDNFNFINAYLKGMIPCIEENQGVIDKFIGDAIMALFLSPSHAIRAASSMRKELERYNKARQERGFQRIEIGVGIHTGLTILGTVGNEDRMNTTVISDTVNIAARLESYNKQLGTRILLSEKSVNHISEDYLDILPIRYLGFIPVKGRLNKIGLFEYFGHEPEAFIAEKMKTKAELFKAHELQKQGLYQAAEESTYAVAEKFPADSVLKRVTRSANTESRTAV